MAGTEQEKMLRGELYLASDPVLVAARVRARRLWQRYNATDPESARERAEILHELLGRTGADVSIEPPFHCDYGTQIALDDGVYINMGCVFLDPAPIRVGKQAFLGPCVQLLTATHPLSPSARVAGPESARSITLGPRVWLGGGVIVCPGVTIGEGTTIGAGSVVTRDIPAGVVAVGNPCRVVRAVGD
jgi:maltose O-acetyltransferase